MKYPRTSGPLALRAVFLSLVFAFVVSPGSAQAPDTGKATFRQMESSLNQINTKMKRWADDYRNKGVVAPPNLSGELTTLKRYVDHYLATVAPTTAPVKNSLKQLVAEQNTLFADDTKALNRAKKNIDTMADVYEQIWRKHRRAHKLTAVLLTGKGMVDVLGLVTVFDQTFWPIGNSFFTSMLTDYKTGKWKARGDLLVGDKSMESLTRKLRQKHLELKKELESVPKNLDEAILRTGKVRYLSKDCWDMAKQLQKEIKERKTAVELRNDNISKVLEELSKKIDLILAKRAILRQCTIDPSPVVFGKIGESRPVTITKIYSTGLQKKAEGTEVKFSYDVPRVVTFSTTKKEIIAKAVAQGTREVKITVTEGDRQANARVTVEVGGTGSRLLVKPKQLQLGVGVKNSLKLSIVDNSGNVLPTKSTIQWASDDTHIATVDGKGIVQGISVGTTYIRATHQGQTVSVPVTVTTSAGSTTTHGQPTININITSDSDKFLPNTPVTFTRNISGTNPNHQYTFSWLLDGKPITAGKSFMHRFTAPGRHYVQLVMKSSDPKENDAVIKNFNIEYPPEIEAKIEFIPETNVYEVGATVGFVAKTKHAQNVTEYRWYVNDKYVGSGATGVEHQFTTAGTYDIRLGLRMGSNFDEIKTARTLTIGETKIGTLGRWRNRFEATGAPENLVIRSSYWVGGDGKWSQPTTFSGSSIGPVENYLLYTGEQADGWNTGYLVYVPRNTKILRFKVFHFRWPKNPKIGPSPNGFVHYSGQLPRHTGKTPIADSLRFIKKAARLCDVQWQNQDGSYCSARISKFKPSKTIRYSGVEDLGCKKGVRKTEEGDLPLVLLKTNRGDITVELFEDDAPNTVANFISLVERGFYDGLTFHRVIKGFLAITGCPKGDGTGGPGYKIPCECYKPGARKHLRGSLSMAHSGRDTGGSQFFIMLDTKPMLDGKHTVFGQVIKGMDAVLNIQQKDKIISAKVIRKRPHEYTPKKMAP